MSLLLGHLALLRPDRAAERLHWLAPLPDADDAPAMHVEIMSEPN